MQLFAAAGNDAKLLSVAAWCEARLPFPGLALPSERGRPPDSR